jgi:hypothetical protein
MYLIINQMQAQYFPEKKYFNKVTTKRKKMYRIVVP